VVAMSSEQLPDRVWLCADLFMGNVMEVSVVPEIDSRAEYVRRDVVEDMIDSAIAAAHDLE
jgi:hypothetical protein